MFGDDIVISSGLNEQGTVYNMTIEKVNHMADFDMIDYTLHPTPGPLWGVLCGIPKGRSRDID